MRKAIILALLISLLCACLPAAGAETVYTNEETGFTAAYADEAGLVTDEAEKEAILSALKDLTQWCSVAFVTTKDNRGLSEAALADRYGQSLLGRVSRTVFLIDMATRQLRIETDGAASKILTGSVSDTITDNVYRDARRGDYGACAWSVFDQMARVFLGQRLAEPMKIISNVLISLLVSVVILYTVLVQARGHKRKAAVKAASTAVVSTVGAAAVGSVVTKKVRLSSNSGGGGFHGGGGGGFHGGGGGGGGHSGGGHGF